jgi:poly(beta-D-mannuronate) lyase
MKTKIPFGLILMLLMFSLVSITLNSKEKFDVNTTAGLQKALQNPTPGDTILLADGQYDEGIINIGFKGTKEKPLLIKAKNQGKAIIMFPVKLEGEYILLEGISFSGNGNIEIAGKGCRVSRCAFNDAKSGKWLRVLAGSSQIEIDHNLFQNKTNNRELDRNCQLIQVVVRNENEQHHIHHNLFREIPKGKTGNGFETLQLITENNPIDPPGRHSNSVIEDNLFIRCNGEAEIISVKSNGNVIRRNTFRACAGSLVLRHGDNNVVTANFFIGDGEKNSGGVRIQGTDQIVANNYFDGLGQLSLGMMDGTPDNLYIRVERAQILFNSFINCPKNFVIGMNHSSHPNGTVPKDCRIVGNLFYYDKPEKPENFIEYIQNDQPENWIWEGNIAYGASVLKEIKGFQTVDPQLKFQENGLAVPTSETPEIRQLPDADKEIQFDLFGQKWKINRSVGAILFPIQTATFGVLTEEKVGPLAF